VEIEFAANEPFFTTLIHYGSKSGILNRNRFCCKRTIFCYYGIFMEEKNGIKGYFDRSGRSDVADLTAVHPGMRDLIPEDAHHFTSCQVCIGRR
jgi:hypothetical protein